VHAAEPPWRASDFNKQLFWSLGTHESLLSWKCCSKKRRIFSEAKFSSPIASPFSHLKRNLRRRGNEIVERPTPQMLRASPKSFCPLVFWKSESLLNDLLSWGLLAKQDSLTMIQLILPHRSISSFWFPRTPQMIISLQIDYSGEWQLDEANEAATAEISEQRTAHLTSCWLDWVANNIANLQAEEPPNRKDITITPRTKIVWQTYIIVFLHK